MQHNLIDLVKSFGSAFLPRISESGIIELPDFGNMQRNKQRLSRMKQGQRRILDMASVRSRLNNEELEAAKKEQQRQALNHWFEDDKAAEEEALNERLGDLERGRRYGLPAIEPLPSVEDSFLAWSSEDAYMLDAPVLESWRSYGDDDTSLVYVDRHAEFASAMAEFEHDFDKVSTPVKAPAYSARNDFWID